MLFNRHKNIRITYGISVCNEAIELDTLLTMLTPLISKNDEIIVLQDITNKNEETTKTIDKFKAGIICIEAKLNGDFSTFKNLLIAKATGDYLFQIDADELPQISLLKKIKRVLYRKEEADCFLVPRINIVNGLTAQHIEKWSWVVNEQSWVNFPDYQFRLFKLNGNIKWENKIHEILTGYKKRYELPVKKNQDFCLIHVKNIQKQEKQNKFYDSLS